jgi:hypothetical protein
VQRRNLTSGQRAIVAAKEWGLEEKHRGGRHATNGSMSLKSLAKQFHVSERDIVQARDLLRAAPI